MPAPLRPSPAPFTPRLGACLLALGLGCPAPTAGPTTPPASAPASPASAPAGPAGGTVAPTGPVVLFTVSDGVLAPLLCHDGQALVQDDATECLELAPVGDPVALDTGARATLAEPAIAPCNGVDTGQFPGRRADPLGDARLAVWPTTASTALALDDARLSPTADELAAMTDLLVKETEGLFEVRPVLEATSGLLADLDADGAADRVFATHEGGRLHGVVAAFLARAPSTPVPLSVLQFDVPRLVAVTDVDGRPGQEVVVEASFVEGIGDHDVISAISARVLALHDGAPAFVGSWGCRMF